METVTRTENNKHVASVSNLSETQFPWACEICDKAFITYEECVTHEVSCVGPLPSNTKTVAGEDSSKRPSPLLSGSSSSLPVVLKPTAEAPIAGTTTKIKDRNRKNTRTNNNDGTNGNAKSRAGKRAMNQKYVHRPRIWPVPLVSSLTREKAGVSLCRLHYLLVDNLEFFIPRNGTKYANSITLRCSNCHLPSSSNVLLQSTEDMHKCILQYREHYDMCASTPHTVKEEMRKLQDTQLNGGSMDTLQEYCNYIKDLYGMMNQYSHGDGNGISDVIWGTCKYILVDGYTSAPKTYVAIQGVSTAHNIPPFAPKKEPLNVTSCPIYPPPPSTSQIISNEIPSKAWNCGSRVLLSDYDYYVIKQFCLIASSTSSFLTRDLTTSTKPSPNQSDTKESSYMMHMHIQCQMCGGFLPNVSFAEYLVSARQLSNHLRQCPKASNAVKATMFQLESKKHTQMLHSGVVPLKEYTHKLIFETYKIKELQGGGMGIAPNTYPYFANVFHSKTPVLWLPLAVEKIVQPVSQQE